MIPNPQVWPRDGINCGLIRTGRRENHSVLTLDFGQLMGSSPANGWSL